MSAQHRNWLNRGGFWRLCGAGVMLRERLRRAGYTVYDLGNDDHLDHQPPEDHTPYSATGWPGASAYGVVMAIDIMPPPAGSGLPSLQWLGWRLLLDKRAGLFPPVKYMNWGPSSDDRAIQTSWEPGEVTSSTSDTGHIHISFRTDMADWAGVYNPLATLREGEDEMSYQIEAMVVAMFNGWERTALNPSDPGGNANPWLNTQPPPGKGFPVPLVALIKQQAAPPAPGIDVDALSAALAERLHQVDEVTIRAAVQAVLDSEAGQAAIVRADQSAEGPATG